MCISCSKVNSEKEETSFIDIWHVSLICDLWRVTWESLWARDDSACEPCETLRRDSAVRRLPYAFDELPCSDCHQLIAFFESQHSWLFSICFFCSWNETHLRSPCLWPLFPEARFLSVFLSVYQTRFDHFHFQWKHVWLLIYLLLCRQAAG